MRNMQCLFSAKTVGCVLHNEVFLPAGCRTFVVELFASLQCQGEKGLRTLAH